MWNQSRKIKAQTPQAAEALTGLWEQSRTALKSAGTEPMFGSSLSAPCLLRADLEHTPAWPGSWPTCPSPRVGRVGPTRCRRPSHGPHGPAWPPVNVDGEWTPGSGFCRSPGHLACSMVPVFSGGICSLCVPHCTPYHPLPLPEGPVWFPCPPPCPEVTGKPG